MPTVGSGIYTAHEVSFSDEMVIDKVVAEEAWLIPFASVRIRLSSE